MCLQKRWLRLFVTLASLILFAGCSPEFTSDSCASDEDCFVDQTCNSQGFCVDSPARVLNFEAEPELVQAGGETTLSWQTSAATSATITTEEGFEYQVPGEDIASGETTVSDIQADTTFRLTVSGSGGSSSAIVEVELVASAPPTIVEFSADETDVAAGSTVTLSWSVSGADSISIEQDGAEITSSTEATGTYQVTIDEQTSFFLVATNTAGDTTSDRIEITLLGAPTVTSFIAMPATDIVPGAMIQLSWIVEDADLIVITDSSDAEIGRSTSGESDVMTTVTADETFTLTATNDAGETVETVSVTTIDLPTINDFSASESIGVVPGTTIDLDWDVTGADTITIEDSLGNQITSSTDATGTAQALVNADETYTLVAENAAGEVSEQVEIEVLLAPVISDFSASRTMDIVPGNTIDLTWDVTDADTVTIEDSSGAVLNTSTMATGTYVATVTTDETYTLTASNGAGSADQDISVTVLPNPTVTVFSASQTSGVVPGSQVVLSWDVSGADAVSIVDAGGSTLFTSTMQVGTFPLTVNSNITVTLQATNAAGTTSSTPVQITILGSPVVSTFSASQSADVIAGSDITLSWATTDAESVEIVDSLGTVIVDSMMATGSVTVTVNADETYTINATNPVGTTTVDVQVTILAVPTIDSFTATESTNLEIGQSITFDWTVTGAATVTLENSVPTTLKSSTLDTDSYLETVAGADTYTLTATNAAGSTTQTITTTLRPAPSIVSFTPSQSTDIVAGSMISLSWQASETDAVEITDSSGVPVATATSGTGSAMVTVNADETYTLTVSNPNGNDTATTSVTVLTPPTITDFSPSSTSVTEGSTVVLSWDVSGADSIAIEDSSGAELMTSTMATGTFTVTMNSGETYTLIATNGAGTTQASVTIAVPAVVDSFSADTSSSVAGAAVVLSWTTSTATSVTVTGDQGATNYAAPSADLDAGSVTVRPQVTTVYTVTATNADGSDTATVTITVDAGQIYITEVFYDAAAGDTDLEWVELYNAGDTFVDLANYSLGSGGTDYTTTTYQLASILIAPGQTVVVGGPLSTVDNGTPTLDQNDPITMQNGGPESDGVALFFETAANLTPTTIPIDKVVWGTPNTNNLIDESGNSATDLSPDVASGNGLVRSGTSDVFVETATLQPNLPIYVSSLSVNRGPNESLETFTIDGFGFDANLDDVKLGTADVNCTNTGLTSMLCNLAAATTQTGDVDLTITRVNEYVEDANGDPIISALAVGDQRTYTLPSAFFFEGRVTTLPPGGFTGFYCSSFVSSPPVVVSTGVNVTVTGLLYVQGFTEAVNGNTVPAGWTFEVGYVSRGDVPYQVYDALWNASPTQTEDTSNTDNELFVADFTSALPLQVEAAFRVSPDGGTNWIYCDSETKFTPGSNAVDWEEGDFIDWQ